MISWSLVLQFILLASFGCTHVDGQDGQFYGAALSSMLEKQANGSSLIVVELITGWVLGKGPCGQACSLSDIGRATRLTRPGVVSSHPGSLGDFTLKNKRRFTNTPTITNINAIVEKTYNETVIDVDENRQWEQEIMHFSVLVEKSGQSLKGFDGYSRNNLSLQTGRNMDHWFIETHIRSGIRSDTKTANKGPRSLSRPYYRVALNKVSRINIPTLDADGDIVKCEQSILSEGGSISMNPPPNIKIFDNCTVYINASYSAGYRNNSWIAIPVSVRDYNRDDIVYGADFYTAGHFSLSTSSVQFAVQVLDNLEQPFFVEPSFENNHVFIIYAGSTWSADIYAEAPQNATIYAFKAFGMQQENVKLQTPIQQDPARPQIRFTTMSWNPTVVDIGRHVVCIKVNDSNGIYSLEDRCFSLIVRPDVFNYSSSYTQNKPDFVDIPSPNQTIDCTLHATCTLVLNVKSAIKLKHILVTESYIDKYQVGEIQTGTYKGQQVYKAYLTLEPTMFGDKKICLIAKDANGGESDNVCISSHIEPPDPCSLHPCKNSASCVMDHATGGFKCHCLPLFFGRACENKVDKCFPYPCVKENTMTCFEGKCYCNPGFAGEKCDINIYDCPQNACNDHGMCKDSIGNYTCECFERYAGVNCAIDNCPLQNRGTIKCPEVGCATDSCNGRGVCSTGGHCTCAYGYYGHQCETPKCDITWTSTGIISPSAKDGSTLICYTQSDFIIPCSLRVFFTGKPGLVPTFDIETTKELQNITTTGPAKKSSDLPGFSTIYSTDIEISGTFNSSNFQYICVMATYINTKSSVCYAISIISNPETITGSQEYFHRNAKIKFVQPTFKDGSKITLTTWERRQLLLYTSIRSNRSSCNMSTPVTHLNGTINGGCDIDDKDNDDGDTDLAAKDASPCCEDVISSSAGVTVYPTHPRGPNCVTEAAILFDSVGENEICFQSASSEYQQLCYTVQVYAKDTRDPCLSSPCQNNGFCFRTDQDKYRCVCSDKYHGENCEKGPCQPADNNCQNGAYCQVDNGVATCICKAGFFGPTCNEDPSSVSNGFTKFTDTAKPSSFSCVIYQQCGFSVILSGQPANIPTVYPGYIDPTLLLEEIKTVDRKPIPDSFQTDVILKGLELGEKDLCLQTKDIHGVNKDELCVKVNVVSDVILLYGFKDRPHFIEPSLPNAADVECLAGGPCHVLYHVTSGSGHEKECVSIQAQPPTGGFVNYHIFSTCDNCITGNAKPSNGNCTVDISVLNEIADKNTNRTFCLSLFLKGAVVEEGETRCFNIHIKDPKNIVKKGCQAHECKNGGFCDGHDPANPVCFCVEGFSGPTCESAKVDSPMTGNQTQTLIGDIAVPTNIKCMVMKTCGISFQIVSKTGSFPKVSLGYHDPHLKVGSPLVKALGNSTTVFHGQAVTTPDTAGNFKFCFQVILNSKTDDEMCVNVEVSSEVDDTRNQYFPYFLPPTLSSDAMVVCSTGKPCHFDTYFTSGDQFGYAGRCPILTVTSRNLANIVHIFDTKRISSECNADVSYLTPSKAGEHMLCLQVSLPGKKGEEICYNIKVLSDVRKEVLSPCLGQSCANDGTCIADFRSTPPKTFCYCAVGFSGPECRTAEVASSTDKMCFSCTDLVDLSFCDAVEHCQSNEICFVEKYTLANGHKHYKSGCKDRQTCYNQSINGTSSCLQCCENSFCNSEGCGGTAFPPRQSRGPLCLDCAHVSDPIDCDQVAFCSSDESCRVEKVKWGDAYLYHLGCESTLQCSFEISRRAVDIRSIETRSAAVCHACCDGDFCNRNCSNHLPDNQGIIVG
ncbi:uncharacterized protein LOC132754484 [Ruditapes philippinarum]|uniref:uncharacterized protein LOC132754484 n=1 Tax=Ruditapes philippinarum TaxID=129788 RepID=UPI00295B82B4|nr:uncharacterized protein LOC132754484 [Ruditapes philippinarum]